MASTDEFRDMLRGAILRHQLVEDQVTYLRLSILQAAGVTFDEALKALPKPNAPTFEKIAGRAPMDILTGKPVKTTADEAAAAPLSEKAQRALARLDAAAMRKNLRGAAKKPGTTTRIDKPTPDPEPEAADG